MKRKLLAFFLVLVSALSFCLPVFAAPSTVKTSTVTTAVSSPQQRGCFYVNSYHWVFFTDGTNFRCRSSSDSATWAEAGNWVNKSATSANRFSVALDKVNGTRFSYAYTKSSNNYVYWRQGVLGSGSITWEGAGGEQTIVSTLTAPFYPSVDYDETGMAWVGVTFLYSTSNYYWRVYLNTVTTGLWSTDAQYPVDLLTLQSVSVRGCVLGLTTNGAVTLYVKATPVIYAWELDGGGKKSGSSEETASDSTAATVNDWSASKNGNTIILQWHSTNALPHTNQFRCAQRVSGSWGASTQIGTSPDDTGTANIAPVASVDTSTGDIYCVIPKIRTATTYSHYKNGVFVANHEEPTGFYDQLTLQTSLQTYGNMLTIVWLQSGTSPRNVRFDAISVAAAPSAWTWRFSTSSLVFDSEKWTISKTFRETGQAATLDSKRFLAWFSWKPNALSLALSATFYQRLVFMWKPSVLSWVVGSERIVRTVPFPQEYDSSSALGGLGLLMNYRYPATSVSETFVSQAFVKHLVFRQTGLSETLGSLYWTKIISFITYTETTVCQATGSERWLMQLVFNRGDSSSFLSSSAWLMRFRYDESSMTETVSSREFIKNLVFRETGLSKTLGFLAWNKVIEFFSFTESAVSQTVGSVSWAVGAVQSHLILVMVILLVLCLLGGVLFLAYRRKTE